MASINICVVSLSETPDLLSQWRAYGGIGSGFSLGFHTDQMEALTVEEGFLLGKCVYESGEQEKLIGDLIDECLQEPFRTIIEHQDEPHRVSIIDTDGTFSEKLASLAPTIKHEAFAEEREWRIISRPLFPRDLSYRSGHSMVVPFFKFKFGEDRSHISKIVVGPTPHPDLSKKAIDDMLKKHGIYKTIVQISAIPFRSW